MALVPLSSEDEGKEFKLPSKQKRNKGDSFEDESLNDFDDRFEELRQRELKREDKLLKKTLGLQKSKQHGAVNHV
jgi:hypothetical protein